MNDIYKSLIDEYSKFFDNEFKNDKEFFKNGISYLGYKRNMSSIKSFLDNKNGLESEKIIEYKKLKNKKNRLWSEMLSMAKNKLSNDEISKITLDERIDKLSTKIDDIYTKAKKMADIDDKMKEIESSLNEDEKKEFEQLGLLNDEES